MYPRRGEGHGWFYFLHYNGWNKKYDEWVEAGGIVSAEEAAAVGAVVSAGFPFPLLRLS
jgi:mortality factor 4-like protein 1